MTAALLAIAQQPAPPPADRSGTVEIPVQLSHDLRADKAHIGNVVEFRTLEAVLVSKEVVPADARLYGRVISVEPKHGDKPSWLAVLVERADWKRHSLPLQAVITAQIVLSQQPSHVAPLSDSSPHMRTPTRENTREALADGGPELTNVIKPPLDAGETSQQSTAPAYPTLHQDVHIFRDKSGITYLVCADSNVKLPGGLLLMLRNEPVRATTPVEAAAH